MDYQIVSERERNPIVLILSFIGAEGGQASIVVVIIMTCETICDYILTIDTFAENDIIPVFVVAGRLHGADGVACRYVFPEFLYRHFFVG